MENWAEQLGLAPHPEGGWYRETWRTGATTGDRAVATGIYFLLNPGEESRWHRVRGSDEVWLWHRGGPLALRTAGTGARPSGDVTTRVLGADLTAGEEPQLVVAAGEWQAAAPAGDLPVLVSCVVAPGFDFADFELI